MLIENIELTMSHVGLGALNEYALLLLFGNAHSHHLTLNTAVKPDQIKDNQGLTLYPAYFMTDLKVPPASLLASTYKLWDRVSVGVDVARFGETILESHYILGSENDLAPDRQQWDGSRYPLMRANSLLTVDVTETGSEMRKVSVPKADHIATLPKMTKPPEAIIKARKIRSNGFGIVPGKLATKEPILYFVTPDQDAAPGHAMVFAKFSKMMDYAEYLMLSQHFKPGFPALVLHHLALLERETFYYGNCFAGETLEIYLNGEIEICEPDYHGASLQMISAALLNYQVEIYQQRNRSLLTMARVKKLLALPTAAQDLIPDVQRLIRNC